MTISEGKKETSINSKKNNSTQEKEKVLSVENLKTYYPVFGGFFKRTIAEVKAVDGVSFSVAKGETLALVGESGCGKTTIGNSILNLVPATEGKVHLRDKLIVVGRENLGEKVPNLSLISWIFILSIAGFLFILCSYGLGLPLTSENITYFEMILYVDILGSIALLIILRRYWQKIDKSASFMQNSLLKQKYKFALVATGLGIYLYCLYSIQLYKTDFNLYEFFNIEEDEAYLPITVLVLSLLAFIIFNPVWQVKVYLMILVWIDDYMKLHGIDYKNPDSFLAKYHKRLMAKTNVYSKDVRKRVQIVFQDPDSSLNPRWKIVNVIGEPLRALLKMRGPKKIRRKVLQLLETVSMKNEHLDRYPHEFSGGQKQRIVISRALACNPDVIVLDEPTSALDVSVQAQILNLLKDLQRKFNLAFLFITHDLSVVQHIADRVAVMYLGKFVEIGKVDDVFYNPSHPYTKALLSARPTFDPSSRKDRIILKGEIPSPINPPTGCAFHPRCFEQNAHQCDTDDPVRIEISEGHYMWCKPYKKA